MGGEVMRELGDGLVLRAATEADTEAVVDFNTRVHSQGGWDTPDSKLGYWVGDLMSGRHPTTVAGDFLIVEDTATGAVVSSTVLIPQTWSYAGIEFGVGRPELVGTQPDYRRRGLIREQFEVLHRWSAERGHLVQAITGIPWYYRQFGYDMALDLYGARSGSIGSIPKLKDGEPEPYRVHPARETDLAYIATVAEYGDARDLVACKRGAAQWRYELDGHTQGSLMARHLRIIETAAGARVGFLAHSQSRWGSRLFLTRYELEAGASWWEVTPSVLRHMAEVGASTDPYIATEDGGPTFSAIGLGLGGGHPVYDIVADWMPKLDTPYAWYVRVPDVPAFLSLIAPVLEQRLAVSLFAGYTGELRMDFYRGGVKVVFASGRISAVEPWQAQVGGEQGNVHFPDLAFLQVLFGYRSLDELQHAYPDCGGNLEGRLLTKALFPKVSSAVWPIA